MAAHTILATGSGRVREGWRFVVLRRHYALTLRHWIRRLETCEAEAVQQVSELVYRTWRLMAACALQFERGDIGVYQIVAARRCGTVQVPLARRDLYVTG